MALTPTLNAAGDLPADAAAVLEFWYGSLAERADPAYAHRYALWFGRDADEDIRARFGALVERLGADAAERSRWCASARGALAVIIALDQLNRNIHRATARMFAHDELCLEIARALVRDGAHVDGSLTPPECAHMSVCLSHSEDEADHKLNVETLFPQLLHSPLVAPAQREHLRGHLHMARVHCDEVSRWKRFPHRNALLGRESSAEELAWLAARDYGYHRQTRK